MRLGFLFFFSPPFFQSANNVCLQQIGNNGISGYFPSLTGYWDLTTTYTDKPVTDTRVVALGFPFVGKVYRNFPRNLYDIGWYCWWKKSQTTTWDVENTVHKRVNCVSAGAWFSSINSINRGAVWEDDVFDVSFWSPPSVWLVMILEVGSADVYVNIVWTYSWWKKSN